MASAVYSKVKSISEDLHLSETDVARVLYAYLAWCLEEVVLDGETKTLFGKLKLDNDNRLVLQNDKYGLLSLIDKKDIKIIRKIVENGPDAKIFELS